MTERFEWALVGNPNCGKTTLFNRLTGANQHVGNWPGVTVEKVSGSLKVDCDDIDLVDLPGLYALADDAAEFATDELVAQQAIAAAESDVYINVVDGSNLERHLFLTSQLIDLGLNLIVAVNMMDNVRDQSIDLDLNVLAKQLGCPVVGIASSRGEGVEQLLSGALGASNAPTKTTRATRDVASHYGRVEAWLAASIAQPSSGVSLTDRIDNVVLHQYFGIPVFLAVVYVMFMFSINIGSAFIDLFDQVAGVLFVETPQYWLSSWGVPDWLTVFLTDGLGGGIQLVASFIPVIAAMFLILAWLEDSGYMARAAFVMDRLMRALGLPGKAFIPLIVGFGCNVPAVMATRTLNNERDRITAILMAPFMSCGARLTVYALFAAAFFPAGGHNMVFALYLIGILIAVLSAFAMKKTLLQGESGHFVLELPNYHLPLARNILLRTWHRLKGFVVRAGKAIVIVVMALNVLNSFGTDGSIGNQDSEKSVLSAIGKSITPMFEPMGLEEENWPATVGIFTGIFAKEVVVGTLDSLYSQPQADDGEADFSFWGGIADAFATVPENLAGLAETVLDPLGFSAIETDLDVAAEAHEIDQATFTALQKGFGSTAAAFAYLLFVLLYIPCVATVGAIYRELNWQWSLFITVWTFGSGYGVAVGFYQAAIFASQPGTSVAWLVGITAGIFATLFGLRRHAKGVEYKQRDIIARTS